MVIHQTCSRMKNTSLSTSFVPWIFFSALKKSQKEATALVHRCGKAKDFTAINCPGSSTGPSKLENDLMNQWRSLFLHMESVLTNENNELVSNSYCTLNKHIKVFTFFQHYYFVNLVFVLLGQQANYTALADIRESCRINLESINKRPEE